MLELFGFAWVTITFACCVVAIYTRRSVRGWLAARADRRRHDDTVEIVRRPMRKVATYTALVVLALPAGVLAGGSALPGPSGGGGGLPTTGGTMTGQVVSSGVSVDWTSGTNEDLVFTPNGTGQCTCGTSFTGVSVVADAAAGAGESWASFTSSDAPTSAGIYFSNVDTTNARVSANMYMFSGGTAANKNWIQAAVTAANDTGTEPVLRLQAMTTIGGSIVTRPFFSIASAAEVFQANVNGTLVTGRATSTTTGTVTNCADGAGAAACAAAPVGAVVVDDGATTVVVSTTAVTANSNIMLTYDSSLGARLGVTCNTTIVQPTVSARTAATSFTITISADPAGANPACIGYTITN